jgi:hypothetical protein
MRHVQLLNQKRNISIETKESFPPVAFGVRNVNITGFEFVDYTLFLVNYG